uniref:Uncharacterized protein LOC100373109 isoform X1 n=1 Tax=Saccoglossus kowalevskii TaxID=10224 RepID=A0ABM0GMN0_SACKO|nr:PREDICTED: uncharacterized protein LOC100373109 isoform X1 [Saccoglossus kowalevskii]
MAMATAAQTYQNLKAKRTQAVAPRTLFGTNIEIKKKGTSAEAYPTQQKARKPTKAEQYVRFQQPEDAETLRYSQSDYKKQWRTTTDAKSKFDEVEKNALYFRPSTHTVGYRRKEDQFRPAHITDRNPYRTDIKLSATDVAHPELFNTMATRPNYNYDLYRNPQLRDNSDYQLIGNVFGKGGQFSGSQRTGHGARHNKGQGEYHSPIIQSSIREPRRSLRTSNNELPRNIRHKYGGQIIHDLLGDDNDIEEALVAVETPEQKRERLASQNEKARNKFSPGYEALSNHLRYDHFSGVPQSKLRSLNTDSYTEDAFKRNTQNYPPKFGVQKNADSKWNEDNVIRDRLKKAWDATIGKPKETPGM